MSIERRVSLFGAFSMAVLTSITALFLASVSHGQTLGSQITSTAPTPKTSFKSPRALYEWIQVLIATYGWPITYEELLWPSSAAAGHLYPNLSPGADLANIGKLIDDHFDASQALQSAQQGAKAVLEQSLALYIKATRGAFKLLRVPGCFTLYQARPRTATRF